VELREQRAGELVDRDVRHLGQSALYLLLGAEHGVHFVIGSSNAHAVVKNLIDRADIWRDRR
jgi:hypothetical protein